MKFGFASTVRPPRAHQRGMSAGAAALMAVAPIAMAQSPASALLDPAPAAQQPESAQLLATLTNPAAEPAVRETAADQLVALAHRGETVRLLTPIILQAEDPDRSRAILLSAIARAWQPPARLFRPLVESFDRGAGRPTPEGLMAIGAYRSREAATILIRFLPRERPPLERDAAIAALTRMTGRDDLWSDPAAAAAWLERADAMGQQAWDDMLAEGVWRRMQRLESDGRAAAERLTDGYRRLYLALPAVPGDERTKLLTQMLLGSRPELRSLGMEIVSREASAGKVIDAAIAEAAASLLRSPDAAIRASAAGLLTQLGASAATQSLLEALAAETDPTAAAALLRAAARSPNSAAIEPALRWMRSSQAAFPAAVECLYSIFAADLLMAPEDRAAALAALRSAETARLTPPGCRLLAALGTSEDRDRVARIIEGDSASMRLAAAGALASRPEYLDAIMAAAGKEPSLFNIAVRAISECQPTAEGFARLAALTASMPEDHRLGLIRASSMLPAGDLLRVAREAEDPVLRETMLSRLAQFGPGAGRSAAEDPRAIMEGLVLLAETRLALRRPDLAVSALDVVPQSPEGIDPVRITRLRAVALIWANQLARATELDAPIDAWLDGLERAIGEPHARAILREIEVRYGSALTESQAARLRLLASKLTLTDVGAVEGAVVAGEPEAPLERGK